MITYVRTNNQLTIKTKETSCQNLKTNLENANIATWHKIHATKRNQNATKKHVTNNKAPTMGAIFLFI